MPESSFHLLSYIDQILKMNHANPRLDLLLASLKNYLYREPNENIFHALEQLFTQLQQPSTDDNKKVYSAIFSVILTHLLNKKKTRSDDTIESLTNLLRRCLDADFNDLFIALLENENIHFDCFSNEFIDAVFAKLGNTLDDNQNPILIQRRKAYQANYYVRTLLRDELYLSEVTLVQKISIFTYLQAHCKSEAALNEFKANILKKIHKNRNNNLYFPDEEKPYKTALGFILRVTFPLLHCEDQSRIDKFLEKPYRTIPVQHKQPIVHYRQPNRFWSFCHRHPYLIGFGITLGILSLVVAGLATFGVLHLVIGFIVAAPILPILSILVSTGGLTTLFGLMTKPISKHFSKPEVSHLVHSKPLDYNFKTSAILKPLLTNKITIKEREVSSSEDEPLNLAAELPPTRTEKNRLVEVVKPPIIEPNSDQHVNLATLITRFALKPAKHPIRKTAEEAALIIRPT